MDSEAYENQIKALKNQLALYKTWAPPGHFYSPIPSISEIKIKEKEIFNESLTGSDVLGIDFNTKEQLRLLDKFAKFYKDMPFKAAKSENLRYFFENSAYSYSDAICLHLMIRFLRPKRVIEIGSGYSSCVSLDTNELFFNNSIDLTFIEPYPELLLSLLKSGDKEMISLIDKPLQEVELNLFEKLEPNDILFIDSTHVSKIGSDVNYIFFEILPRLKKGVFVHFHDIFFLFEYPKAWIYEGRAWNEDYMLRAFLQYNNAFKIVFFNNYLWKFYRELMLAKLPLCAKNPGGSLWMRKGGWLNIMSFLKSVFNSEY